jgi:histidine triad (HIT) family protein
MHGHDPSCIFCRIVRGEIPSSKVLETEHALAFLDLNPVNPGHLLVVPKVHHADLSELPDDVAAETARLIPRLSRAIRAATGADGLNLVVNNGKVAGQTVFHGHWHLIPRHTDDAVRWPWPHVAYASGAMDEMLAKIGEALAADLVP